MRYSEIITYRKVAVYDLTGEIIRHDLIATRISRGPGGTHYTAKHVPFTTLFAGHCEKVASMIQEQNERNRIAA